MAEIEGIDVKIRADDSDFQESFAKDEESVKSLKQNLKSLQKEYLSWTSVAKNGKTKAENLFGTDKAKIEIDRLKQEIVNVQREISQTATKKGLGDSLKGLADGIKNSGISKEISKIALSMFGVATIFRTISKAVNAYLSQNEQLQSQIDGIWYALGSLLAPVLETIVNLASKLVVYINALVQGLGYAGINMSNLNKNASKAKNTLAGFDEINNLANQSQNSAINPLDTPVNTDWLKAVREYAEVIAPLLEAIAGSLLAIKLGLKGIKALGFGVALSGVIGSIKSMINYFNDPSWDNFFNTITMIGVAITGIGIAFASQPAIIAGAIALALGVIGKFWDKINEGIEYLKGLIDNAIKFIDDTLMKSSASIDVIVGGLLKGLLETIKGAIETIQTFLDSLFKGVKQIADGIITMLKGDFKNGLKSIVNGIITLVEGAINTIIKGLNTLLSGVRNLGNSLLQLFGIDHKFGSISSVSLPRLNTGTNYVPQDMIAQVHKGEAIVPRKFNEQAFTNSEETNVLLKQLINVVDSKEFKTYISKTDIGKASVDYINQQNRIIGGSIV